MLTAATSMPRPRGMVRAQGMAFLFASVLRTWVDDDDPGHARSMAAPTARSRAGSAGRVSSMA